MRLDEPKTKPKKKQDPTTRSDYQQQVPKAAQAKPKAASKPRGQAALRGGSKGFKTVDDYKKQKAARDAAKPKAKTKKVVTKPAKSKPITKIKTKPKKNNPKKPKKDNVVKTAPTPKPKEYTATNLFVEDNQASEILNAYLAMAGTELFQYTNSQTIDGMYNDVAIINVLSRRRQAYTPNRLIELAEIFVKHMWVEDGNLCVEIDNSSNLWDQCMLSFTIGSNIEVAYTVA